MPFVRHYLLALQFFTRIPITGALAEWVGFSPAMLRASVGHFPGVGVLVGATAAGVYGLFAVLLPPTTFTPLVAAVLSTVATVLLTGGFHEDGLSDEAEVAGLVKRDKLNFVIEFLLFNLLSQGQVKMNFTLGYWSKYQ